MAIPGTPFGVGAQNPFGAAPLFQRPISSPPFQQIAGNPQLVGQFQQLLQALIGALTQLAQGYQGFGGQPAPGGFPGQGFPGQGFPGQGFPGQPPLGPPPFGGGPITPPFGGYPPYGGGPTPGTPTFPGPGGPGPVGPGGPVGAPPGPGFVYQNLSPNERTQHSGLNDYQRGALHLWGIQMSSEGKQNGAIYFNVLNNPEQFKPAEVQLVRQLYQQEMQMFGGVTGKLLDEHFFGVYQNITGKDIGSRYRNSPVQFAQGPANLANRETGNNGLSAFDNGVLRLWGHDRLDNGQQDGSVVQWSLMSGNAFDSNLNRDDLRALLAADGADNGVRDGTALEGAFLDSLDRIYLGGPGANADKTLNRAGINRVQVGSVLDYMAQNPPPGVPPGVDITNIANIGKCPVLGQSVQQSGLGGVGFF